MTFLFSSVKKRREKGLFSPFQSPLKRDLHPYARQVISECVHMSPDKINLITDFPGNPVTEKDSSPDMILWL